MASERQRRSRPGQGANNANHYASGHDARAGNGSYFGASSSGELSNYQDDNNVDNNMMRSGMGIRPAGATPEERIREKAAAGRRMQQQQQNRAGGRSAQNNYGNPRRGGRGRGRGRGGRTAPSRNSIQVGAMSGQSNATNNSRRLDGTRNSDQLSTLARPGSNITNNPSVETPEERLRRKISSGQSGGSGPYNAAGASSGGSGAGTGTGTVSNANTSGRSDMIMSVQDQSIRNSTPEERMTERIRRKAAEGARKVSNVSEYSSGGDGFDDEGYFHVDSTPQQRMEERLRQKTEMGRSSTDDGVSAYLDQQQRMEAKLQGGGEGGDLERRVRAKADRGGGRAANTDASTGTLTTVASTRFGRNANRHGGAAADSRVSYLSPGVSERMQAKAAGGSGGRGAKYDPRANAVGAYAVAGIGRSESGRGRGRGRGRSHGRGRGRSGRGGRSGRMSNGDNPSIFDRRHTSDHNGGNFANQSTIATNTQAPDDRDVFDNDHDDLEQARELTPEVRGAKDVGKIFGLPRTTVYVVVIALLAAAGIGIGAAARNGAFTSPTPAPTSQTQGVEPPSQQMILPTDSPTASPAVSPLGPECLLNKIAGPRIGASESTVAMSGDIAAIGSPDSGPSGSVAIFTRGMDNTWAVEAVLSPSDGFEFGRSIDIQDDVLVVGATYVDDGGTKRGCVFVYERDVEWELLVRLVAEDALKSDESFGSTVAVDFILDDFNDRRIQVLVGEPFGEFYPIGEKTGSIHIFTDVAGGIDWELQAKLVPGNGIDGDSFGLALDLANSRAVIANANGSVYSFEQDVERRTVWRQRSRIPPVDDPKFGISGSSVSIHHRAVAVGSGGIVRIFDFGRSDAESTLRPNGGDLSSRSFGQNVAIKDDTVIVSAPPFGSAPGEDRLFYVFEKNINRWEQASMFESKDAGSHVAVDGSTVLVGSQDGGEGFVAELCSIR